MATVSLAFRWLDMLEKEFDKAFVDLDLLLGEIDPDQCELTYDGRQKMTALSAAFAQLCHKAQTIFQSNAKLEVNVRSRRDIVCNCVSKCFSETYCDYFLLHVFMYGMWTVTVAVHGRGTFLDCSLFIVMHIQGQQVPLHRWILYQ